MSCLQCLFCKIVNGREPADIIYSDEDVIIFKDIRPKAVYHYLVCPKKHIVNARELTPQHIPLVEKLYCLAKQKISDHGICAREARFGFHWPPFNSISHLHLHAIAPAKEMTLFGHIIFLPNTPWFVTPEYVLNRLAQQVEKSRNCDTIEEVKSCSCKNTSPSEEACTCDSCPNQSKM